MARISTLVGFALVLLSGTAHAFYSEATPPVGWAKQAGEATMRAKASEAWANNKLATTATLNAGGRTASLPVKFTMAPTASRMMARGLFGHPLLLLGGIALPYAFDWAQSKGFFWNEQDKRWEKEQAGFENYCPSLTPAESSEWQAWVQSGITPGPPGNGCTSVPDTYIAADMCKWDRHRVCAQWDGSSRVDPHSPLYTKAKLTNPVIIRVPASPQEFEDELAPQPIPMELPKELDLPVPVLPPEITPMRVPQGQPQPVPNTNPQQYKQPTARINPAPTTDNPWRVDIVPEDVTGTDPNGQPEPKPVEEGDPAGDPKESDLCEKNPDILACQKPNLDTPDVPELETKQVPLTVTPDSGWGASTAQCPAPRYIYPQGRQIAIPFDLFCTYMAGMRPIILAMAWIAAAFIVVGFKGD
jgi:Neisseria meningitidis TspB protein